jgi:hypothetical protein
MARRGPRVLRWLALAVLAVLLAACTGSSKPAPSPSASSGSSPTSSPPPTASPHSWTIESVDSRGATWKTTVAIAKVISGNALTSSATLYGNPCSLDPKTDAIVPFQITTTSTNSGFFTATGDQELKIVNASLGVAPDGSASPKGAQGTQSNAGFAAGEVLKAVEDSSSGPTCSNLDPPGETMTLGSDSLKMGQQVVLKGYFVLKHWTEPAHHDGDTLWLPNIWVLVPSSGIRQNGDSWETTAVSGPAVISLLDYTPTPTYKPSDSSDAKSVGYGWVFPIDGSLLTARENLIAPVPLRRHHRGHRCHRCNLSVKRYQKRSLCRISATTAR